MCGGLFAPDPPKIPPPPPPEPDPLAFIPGSEGEAATVAPSKKGKSTLISDGVGLGIPTGG